MIDFIIIFIISAGGTFYVMPHSIRKLKENNFLALDMYKLDKPQIPTNAGMIVFFTSLIAISLFPLIARIINLFIDFEFSDLSETNLAVLFVVSIFAFYGLIDDLVDIGRILKLILPVCFSFPLISVISPETIFIPFIGEISLSQSFYGDIDFSDIFRILIIPIYIMVVANLINMHSGYNGLQSGLSLILLFSIFAASFMDNRLTLISPFGAFFGSILVFWMYNRYPSKVFEGNIGSLLFGSLIGCLIVVQEYWWFGFFILIPHTFNFFLWIYWLFLMKNFPEDFLDDKGGHAKFGRVNQNGIIHVPNNLTLKWIPNYYVNLDEPSSVYIMYFITLLFCISGILIFF